MKLYDAHSWREAVEMGWWRRPWWDDEAIETGKPVLISLGVFGELKRSEWRRLFSAFVERRLSPAATAAQPFEVRASNGKWVWITDCGPVITMSYPYEA
jgi:hypothetical protein